MRKQWIGTIHGLRSPKYGSVLCATIHELPAQSMDRANEGLKVWISDKQSMDAPKQPRPSGLDLYERNVTMRQFATEAEIGSATWQQT